MAGIAAQGGAPEVPSFGGTGDNEEGGDVGHGGEVSYGGDRNTDAQLAPSAFAGLVLWLEASTCSDSSEGGAGGTGPFRCPDASGHGNDALQTDPLSAPLRVEDVINGHTALRLQGNPSSLVVDDSESLHFGVAPFSMVIVARWNNNEKPSGNYNGTAFLIHKTSNFYPFAGIAVWANYPQIFGGVPAMTRFAAQLEQGTAFALGASNHLNDNQFRVYVVRRTTASEMELRIDGRSEARAQIPPGVNTSAEGQPMIIGGLENYAVAGDLAELVVIAGTVADGEQESLERFLLQKYGLAATSP
ncbi:MAG TPA: hypothetical protein VHB79_10090 [Polyangiaceae bacterium]|nr:hypothetical protein [Polyangiaceae bacterium]